MHSLPDRPSLVRGSGLLMVVLTVLLVAVRAAPAEAELGLTLGFASDPVLEPGPAVSGAEWLDRVRAEGGQIIRVGVSWSGVAPAHPPSGFVASNPASPGYNWSATDAEIKQLVGAGVTPMITIDSAPTWAEGPGMPKDATPGSWRPNVADYRAFATAIATRYDGHYPDPADPGTFLPRVSIWQGWNEPNLNVYLAPQWQRSGKHWVAVAPGIFRSLSNAFYAAVKAVNSSNFVVLGGTAPFGDPPGGQRTPPVEFYRSLFCLDGRVALKPVSCPSGTYFDAIDHHPYSISSPTTPALNPDDASIPDIHKITRVLRAAEKAGRALPKGAKQVWCSEIAWDTDPPNPVQTDARWLEQAFYVLWSQGVHTILWFQVLDNPPVPNYQSTYQEGIYYLDGEAKPAAVAFRFPFVTTRLSKTEITAWGRSPSSGSLMIEEQTGARWKVLRTVKVTTHAVFDTKLAVRGAAVLRAQLGSATSLTWSQGR